MSYGWGRSGTCPTFSILPCAPCPSSSPGKGTGAVSPTPETERKEQLSWRKKRDVGEIVKWMWVHILASHFPECTPRGRVSRRKGDGHLSHTMKTVSFIYSTPLLLLRKQSDWHFDRILSIRLYIHPKAKNRIFLNYTWASKTGCGNSWESVFLGKGTDMSWP